MTPEDRAEMQCRLNQEELLIRHGFKPIPENGGELWISCKPGGVPELWTRAQALEELVVPPFGPGLTNVNANDEGGEVVA